MSQQDFQIVWDTRTKETSGGADVTLIVPVYNVADYVESSIRSILSASYGLRRELIIINDGSTDESDKVVQGFLEDFRPERTLYIVQENAGISAVRNLGVKFSTGRYISFLDSDDFLSSGVIKKSFQFAEDNQCDVVLGRSLVFDGKDHNIHPFYDDWVWSQVLEGADFRVVSKHGDPALFYLEPNPCYRLIRRDLFAEDNLKFPEGYFFEDPPVHYQMLATASRIGLMNLPYYWYRVGRVGKTTSDRSLRRYHILDVASDTFRRLEGLNISDGEGAGIVYGLARIAWWCGTMLPPENRNDYYAKACEIFSRESPPTWGRSSSFKKIPDEGLYLVISAFLGNNPERLFDLSLGRKRPLQSAIILLKSGRKDILIDRAIKIVIMSIKRMSDRVFSVR